ncbi:hypothetical protein Rfer_4316 (plasmid) [Rhodoferax ferrireducens T118]|uniref:Uncharacterized protein n=1 Tax=Albidiferax ferrireducens (strain ATCC BAA-621 / DSM 15236 / T118) TaxID=338969 RepID=Q21QE3_ALBFT|nr:hypothetical protein [Rhodoferax ferrireducens]ABD72002.1 hypothetical protein Rfer_4316 [Rhodoferax ferrireducens T118]
MQELLLVTNRRTRLRVTAWGGVVAGMLVGVCLSAIAGYTLIERQQTAAHSRESALKADYETKLRDFTVEAKNRERVYSGVPMAYLVRAQEANLADLQERLTKFPAFKTDVYKDLFSELSDEIARQAKESRALLTVLSASDTAPAARCAIASSDVGTPSLWSNGKASFYKNGWRGVDP